VSNGTAANPQHAALMNIAEKYRKVVMDRTKNWSITDIAELVKGSLSPDKSGRAISEVITAMVDAEERLYDLSIIKMEARNLLTTMDDPSLMVAKKEFRRVLDLASDGVVIAKNRYEHLQTVLGGIRSINTNMRSAKVNG